MARHRAKQRWRQTLGIGRVKQFALSVLFHAMKLVLKSRYWIAFTGICAAVFAVAAYAESPRSTPGSTPTADCGFYSPVGSDSGPNMVFDDGSSFFGVTTKLRCLLGGTFQTKILGSNETFNCVEHQAPQRQISGSATVIQECDHLLIVPSAARDELNALPVESRWLAIAAHAGGLLLTTKTAAAKLCAGGYGVAINSDLDTEALKQQLRGEVQENEVWQIVQSGIRLASTGFALSHCNKAVQPTTAAGFGL